MTVTPGAVPHLCDIQAQYGRRGLVVLSVSSEEEFKITKYMDANNVNYGAARLWLDAIIEPEETRNALIQAIEMSANNPELPEYRTGVLQT